MNETVLRELLAARERGEACAVATVAATKGSVPREPGAKALIFSDGRVCGTVGGGKFESLVVADALEALRVKGPVLKKYVLHEGSEESFGAICGGEVTVLIEPHLAKEALVIVGAGHCGQALSRLAHECGLRVTVIDDRGDQLALCTAHELVETPAPEFIAGRVWRGDEAIVLVARRYDIDREALAAALQHPGAGYLGMIGSTRKVRRVYDELKPRGFTQDQFSVVHAPIGLDIGSDSPAEIAVSVLAEVLAVLRGRAAKHMCDL